MRRDKDYFVYRIRIARSGLPEGKPDLARERKAETLQDYDAAFGYYQKALKADPYTPTTRLS